MRSANRGNAYNTWNVNSSGNVNNNNAWNANRFAPIVLHRALWLACSAGCPEDFRQGTEIPGVMPKQYCSDVRDSFGACQHYYGAEINK